MKSILSTLIICTAALLLLTPPLSSQVSSVDPVGAELTRVQLEELLQAYERTASSSAYSEELRTQARRESASIRERLAGGDFQVGDQLTLEVEGEEQLSGTFAVQPGISIALPEIGNVSLKGVLRSELEDRLQAELSRYVREPVVRARASIRIVITGGVNRAGYHVFLTSALLSDALMAAGGPATNAAIDHVYIERGGERIWEGEVLQQAIIEGRTLDQMSLRAGDQIVVPLDSEGGFGSSIRSTMMVVVPLIAALGTMIQLF